MAKVRKDCEALAPKRRGEEVNQTERTGCSVETNRPLDQRSMEEPSAKHIRGKRCMRVPQAGCNLDPLTLNSTELNGYPCGGIAIAIVINNDTEQVERSREHDKQPQQRTTQTFLNHRHRVRSPTLRAENRPYIGDYSVTAPG